MQPADIRADESHPAARNGTQSICVVGMHFAPETTGNAPYTTALVDALAASGLAVRMVTGVPHYPQWTVDPRYARGIRWSEERNGVSIRRVRHAVPRKPNLLGRIRMEASFLALAYPVIRRDTSDAVLAVSPTLSGLAAARLAARHRPLGVLIQDLSGNGAEQAGLAGHRVANLINKREMSMLRSADLIGVITPRFAEIMVDEGVDESKIRLLENFAHVQPTVDSKVQSRMHLGWPIDEIAVVHTGNMGRKQGLDTLLRAARMHGQVRPVNYILVGDGNQRAALQAGAGDINNVRFVDPVSEEDYPHVLNAADVLVLCERVGVKEMSLPSKLTSYSVAGRPIVASVEPGSISATTLEGHGAALISPAGREHSLVDAIDRVLDDAPLRQELIAGGARLRSVVGGRAEAGERYRKFGLELLGLADRSRRGSDG